MRAPSHWQQPPRLLARLLAPVAALYGLAGRLRARLTVPYRASVPVICLGNVTAGGTGKTPLAIALAERLRAAGHAPVFLTRGYGGHMAGPVLVDPAAMSAAEVGDEALVLARHARTVVARDRRAGANAAVRAGASVIVMDDGYQNPSLHKDVNLLVADAGAGLGNGLLIPAGPLRERPEAALARADALIVVGPGDAADRLANLARARGLPVFAAALVPAGDTAAIGGKRLLAFAGIGRPQKFFDSLAAAGARVRLTRAFPDHHPFTERQAQALLDDARAHALELVTTEKDMARLAGARGGALAALRAHTLTFRVRAEIDDVAALDRLIAARLRDACETGAYRAV